MWTIHLSLILLTHPLDIIKFLEFHPSNCYVWGNKRLSKQRGTITTCSPMQFSEMKIQQPLNSRELSWPFNSIVHSLVDTKGSEFTGNSVSLIWPHTIRQSQFPSLTFFGHISMQCYMQLHTSVHVQFDDCCFGKLDPCLAISSSFNLEIVN